MDGSILRKHIRKTLSEFFNSEWQFIYGPDKFPYFDEEIKTPAELDLATDSLKDEEESKEKTDLKIPENSTNIINNH